MDGISVTVVFGWLVGGLIVGFIAGFIVGAFFVDSYMQS